MATTLTVRDEAATGDVTDALVLEFLTETITVRELIRARVYQEVGDYNASQRAKAAAPVRMLVQPSAEEEALNGPRMAKARREVDWQKQFEIACDAFSRGGFLVLVADGQKTDLDEQITLGPGAEVTFLRLTPLVGG